MTDAPKFKHSPASDRATRQRAAVRIGCDRIGFMDEYATSSLLLAFEIHGRPIQMKASAKGWAEWYLRENPWTTRRRGTNAEWRAKALKQGMIAINSILRDWCKGQVTAIECGMMPAEAAFLAHMLTSQGVTVLEMVEGAKLLAAPQTKG